MIHFEQEKYSKYFFHYNNNMQILCYSDCGAAHFNVSPTVSRNPVMNNATEMPSMPWRRRRSVAREPPRRRRLDPLTPGAVDGVLTCTTSILSTLDNDDRDASPASSGFSCCCCCCWWCGGCGDCDCVLSPSVGCGWSLSVAGGVSNLDSSILMTSRR